MMSNNKEVGCSFGNFLLAMHRQLNRTDKTSIRNLAADYTSTEVVISVLASSSLSVASRSQTYDTMCPPNIKKKKKIIG